MFLSEWREFPSAPCLVGGGGNSTARVWMVLKSNASLTCFRDCFVPGRATDLKVVMTKFVLRGDSTYILAKGCDYRRFEPMKTKTSSAGFGHINWGQMVYGLIWEVVVRLVQAGFRETTAGLSDKTDWAANEDAVQIQFAVPGTSDCDR